MVSVKGELKLEPDGGVVPKAFIQESDIAAVITTSARPKYRDFIDSLKFEYDLRVGILGYGFDDQASPRIHPFLDSEGSIKTRMGGRSYKRDKKYTAGASITGTVDYKPAAGSPMRLESVHFEVGGTKATAATGQIQKYSGTKDIGLFTKFSMSASNQSKIPAPGEAQIANSKLMDSTHLPMIYEPDMLRVKLETMVNAELFIVRLRATIHGPTDPTVTPSTDLTEAAE